MSPELRRRAEEIYREAVTRDPHERAAFVAARCSGDAELRGAVEALLSRGSATELRHSELPGLPGGAAPIGPGAVVGSYRVDGVLGAGGMGVVYRATDTRLNRPVAIKFLSKMLLDASAARRFQREAQMASALNHPHIVTVHDVGDYAGSQYLVTEFVDGGTLEEWRRSEPRSWRQVAELLIGVADALAAAHASSMLHRDVKPGNILVSSSGYAKLADFGLAKSVQEAPAEIGATASHTRAGAVIGTGPVGPRTPLKSCSVLSQPITAPMIRNKGIDPCSLFTKEPHTASRPSEVSNPADPDICPACRHS